MSLFSKNNKLSVFNSDFANFDVSLPIFNAIKILNNKSALTSDNLSVNKQSTNNTA